MFVFKFGVSVVVQTFVRHLSDGCVFLIVFSCLLSSPLLSRGLVFIICLGGGTRMSKHLRTSMSKRIHIDRQTPRQTDG